MLRGYRLRSSITDSRIQLADEPLMGLLGWVVTSACPGYQLFIVFRVLTRGGGVWVSCEFPTSQGRIKLLVYLTGFLVAFREDQLNMKPLQMLENLSELSFIVTGSKPLSEGISWHATARQRVIG